MPSPLRCGAARPDADSCRRRQRVDWLGAQDPCHHGLAAIESLDAWTDELDPVNLYRLRAYFIACKLSRLMDVKPYDMHCHALDVSANKANHHPLTTMHITSRKPRCHGHISILSRLAG